MNNSVIRNLKCLGRIALRCVAIALIWIIIWGAFVIPGSSTEKIQNFIYYLSWYFGLFIIIVYNVTIIISYFPIILSFGARRKDYFIGKNIINIFLLLLCSAATITVSFFEDKVSIHKSVFTVSMLLILSAMGIFMGNIIWKFGKTGYLVFVVFCGICGGCVSAFSNILNYTKILNSNRFTLIILISGIIMYLISGIFEFSVAKKFEIK